MCPSQSTAMKTACVTFVLSFTVHAEHKDTADYNYVTTSTGFMTLYLGQHTEVFK